MRTLSHFDTEHERTKASSQAGLGARLPTLPIDPRQSRLLGSDKKHTTLVSSRRNFPLPHRGHQVLFAYSALTPNPMSQKSSVSRYMPGLGDKHLSNQPPTPTTSRTHDHFLNRIFFFSIFRGAPRSGLPSARIVTKSNGSAPRGWRWGPRIKGRAQALPHILSCPARSFRQGQVGRPPTISQARFL